MLKSSVDFEKEMVRVRALYKDLSNVVAGYPAEYDLQRQVNDFITGIFIIRSGGFLVSDDSDLQLFPFGCSLKGQRVIIYGGGTFGQQLMKRLAKNDSCEIAGWLDDDYWEYRRCCMDVDPIEQICKVEYDAIVIALIDPVQIEKIKHLLYDYGVEEKMIITVSSSQEQRDKALKLYLQEAHEISEGLHS